MEQQQHVTVGSTFNLFALHALQSNPEGISKVMNTTTVRGKAELHATIIKNEVSGAAVAVKDGVVDAYHSTKEFVTEDIPQFVTKDLPETAKFVGNSIYEQPSLLLRVPGLVMQNVAYRMADVTIFFADLALTAGARALAIANIGPLSDDRLKVWYANQMQFVADFHNLEKTEALKDNPNHPTLIETLDEYTRRRHWAVKHMTGKHAGALASTLDWSQMDSFYREGCEARETKEAKAAAETVAAKTGAMMDTVNATIDEINADADADLAADEAADDATMQSYGSASASTQRAADASDLTRTASGLSVEQMDELAHQAFVAKKVALKQRFMSLFDAVETTLEFNEKWNNGTGYLNGAANDEEVTALLETGEMAKSIDHAGRHAVLLKLPEGLVVVFERYTPEGLEPAGYKLVGNAADLLERHATLQEAISTSINQDELDFIFGVSATAEDNLGKRLLDL